MSRIPTGNIKHTLEKLYTFLKAAPSLINESDAVVTSASPTTSDITVYQDEITSGGTAGAEILNIGNGAGAIVGQRKLVTLETRTNAGDSIVLDHANMTQAALTVSAAVLDAAAEFILLEWRGNGWEIIEASAGVVTAV